MTTEQMDEVDAQRAGFPSAAAQREAHQKAQDTMRAEMEAGVHKPKTEDPSKLSETLEALFGPKGSDKDVTATAYELINEHGTGLVLGFKEWAIVQKLVEAGIVSGRAGS